MKQSKYSSKLALYLVKQFVIPLICCLIGFTMLFLTIDLFDVLQDFVDHEANIADAIAYFLLRQPQRVVVIIPMALMLSAMYTFANFSRHNEVTAIKASGISIIRTCRYIWLVGLACAIFLLWFLEFVVPGSEIRATQIEDRINNPAVRLISGQRLAYHSAESNINWIFSTFNIKGEKKGVSLKKFRPDHTQQWELRSDSAKYSLNSGWEFFECQVTKFDKAGDQESASEMSEHLVGLQLTKLIGEKLIEKPSEILRSLAPIEENSSLTLWRMLETNSELPEKTRNESLSIIYYRLFFPFSCFVALLISLPLSLASGRGGVFVNIFSAILMMAGYYVAINGFKILGQNGTLPPFIALLIPTVITLVAGCIMMYKKR